MNDQDVNIIHKMYDSLKDMMRFNAKAEIYLKNSEKMKTDLDSLTKTVQDNNEQISHIRVRLDEMDNRFKQTSNVYKEELEEIKKATTNIKNDVVDTEKK